MAELNLKQIEDKLNSEFIGDRRKIVFWYDDNGDFEEDIRNLKLRNVKIHYLTHTNLFQTKVLLERKDTKSNYLIYAPFPKPGSRENHLADTIKYSKEFFADRASLLAVDLGIDEKYKPVLQKYIKFFGEKGRTKKFYDLEVDSYDENTIEVALLSVLAKSKVANFEEVVRIVLTANELNNNEYMVEFKKYELDKAFWKHISRTFSFTDDEPNLEKFIISLFLTYAEKEIHGGLSSSMNKYLLSKSGTVIAFMDQLMNNVLYCDKFDNLSDEVYQKINGEELFKNLSADDIVDLDIFRFADEKIIQWIIERLLDENLNASIDGMDIPKLCRFREKKHFGKNYFNEYHLLRHGFYIISQVNYKPESDIFSIIKKYDESDYKIDGHYRKFCYYLDRVKKPHIFDTLQELVENIYTNKYLDVVTKEFNSKFSYEEIKKEYKLQRDFYENFISGSKEMLVVVISDAFRYEVAKELVERMKRNKKFDEVSIEPQIGVLPSYTRLGMASLLPHKELYIDEKYDVYVDGKPCFNLMERDKILKMADSSAGSIQYDDLKQYKNDKLREFFVGKSIVYIYHNQIDARGDKPNTEDEVFTACKETVDEIEELIIKLTDNVSRVKYIVTADHGFIYKKNKIIESDKIDVPFAKDDQVNKRFIVSDRNYEVIGTKKIYISDVLGNDDTRTITIPITSNIFKTAGGGQNFVHGGSSPQEILVPIVQVKTVRGYKKSENVKISLISMLSKITGLIINLDFIQQEPISDVINPAAYKIYFIEESGEIISNEEIYVANSKEKESANRIFKLKFNLKNQKYSRDKKYYLMAVDTETDMEILRHEVIMDIAFADDFGFDI
ncbi:BREX-1 system phosphatase PglZ type A [Clostridium luticellarii]|uniref:PglZ domain protein n=1 Tax=Clostridium luticellarii TaxID=1691940 RepID=A0A2T0B5N5_9CLOT|nr:BREX-1 system phosphatase PglZ type A [Clostridium luticellarii]PRR79204.1 PglZ domain protein [Clostridium luticellarii]